MLAVAVNAKFVVSSRYFIALACDKFKIKATTTSTPKTQTLTPTTVQIHTKRQKLLRSDFHAGSNPNKVFPHRE